MKKLIPLLLILLLLTGCAGVPVIAPSRPVETDPLNPTDALLPGDGSLKTGLAVLPGVGSSADAGEKNGVAQSDITMVAVLVDENGVIFDCVIDAIQAKVEFDAHGQLLTDTALPVPTKNELGEGYGMKQFSAIGKEWNQQMEALCAYAKGKTVAELQGISLNGRGAAADGTDLAASCSVSIGGLLDAIGQAVENAVFLGAAKGDVLKLTAVTSLSGSKSAAGEPGVGQAAATIGAFSFRDDGISSCILDGVQCTVSFDENGAIVSDLTAPILTKNQLGESYGMKEFSSIGKEWNQQAAAFSNYVTGKTPQQVLGIALTDQGTPADADLAASVTIHLGEFQQLIEKAAP